MAARIAAAPSSGAAKLLSSPWNAPIGVRAAETMTIGSGFMEVLSVLRLRHLQVMDQAVFQVVDPAVHLERLGPLPRFLHRGALRDVLHLLAHIQLAQAAVAHVLV